MKFKIRFADQIVGIIIISALIALAFAIVMLGRSQRWFTKDVSYKTELNSAVGLSKNMAVQYKGFTIGNVTDFKLSKAERTKDDKVEVFFKIHEDYKNLVTQGSMVELQSSPIGLGNQFLFYAGLGKTVLEPESIIPIVGSPAARELIRQGHAEEAPKTDLVASMLPQLGPILDSVQGILANLNIALGDGSRETEIGKIIGSLNTTLAEVETLPSWVEGLVEGIVKELMAEIKPLIGTLDSIVSVLDDQGGLLEAVSPEVHKTLVEALSSLSGTLHNLEKTTAVLPAQLSGIMLDLGSVMKNADDVLASLTNNPLLKGGVPEKLESQGGITNPRDIRF